jgi:hypothetical protein
MLRQVSHELPCSAVLFYVALVKGLRSSFGNIRLPEHDPNSSTFPSRRVAAFHVVKTRWITGHVMPSAPPLRGPVAYAKFVTGQICVGSKPFIRMKRHTRRRYVVGESAHCGQTRTTPGVLSLLSSVASQHVALGLTHPRVPSPFAIYHLVQSAVLKTRSPGAS